MPHVPPGGKPESIPQIPFRNPQGRSCPRDVPKAMLLTLYVLALLAVGRTPDLGWRQTEIYKRAHLSGRGYVMPRGWRERRACRKLVERGVLVKVVGMPDVWQLASHHVKQG